jgi:hypothetical protein
MLDEPRYTITFLYPDGWREERARARSRLRSGVRVPACVYTRAHTCQRFSALLVRSEYACTNVLAFGRPISF